MHLNAKEGAKSGGECRGGTGEGLRRAGGPAPKDCEPIGDNEKLGDLYPKKCGPRMTNVVRGAALAT